MWLIIDDKRELGCDVIARTAEAGRKLLASGVKWSCVCMDHDLGTEEDGYDVLIWMEDHMPYKQFPERFQLVTSNPIGEEKMRNLLLRNGYRMRLDRKNFVRGDIDEI